MFRKLAENIYFQHFISNRGLFFLSSLTSLRFAFFHRWICRSVCIFYLHDQSVLRSREQSGCLQFRRNIAVSHIPPLSRGLSASIIHLKFSLVTLLLITSENRLLAASTRPPILGASTAPIPTHSSASPKRLYSFSLSLHFFTTR